MTSTTEWLDTLPERQRRGFAVYYARRVVGLSVEQTAQLMGLTRKQVKRLTCDPFGNRARAYNRNRRRRADQNPCRSCGRPSYGVICRACRAGRTVSLHRRSDECGVPSCPEPKAEGRHVCAAHAPEYDRMRADFSADEWSKHEVFVIHDSDSARDFTRQRRERRALRLDDGCALAVAA